MNNNAAYVLAPNPKVLWKCPVCGKAFHPSRQRVWNERNGQPEKRCCSSRCGWEFSANTRRICDGTCQAPVRGGCDVPSIRGRYCEAHGKRHQRGARMDVAIRRRAS